MLMNMPLQFSETILMALKFDKKSNHKNTMSSTDAITNYTLTSSTGVALELPHHQPVNALNTCWCKRHNKTSN